ncbi:AAA family ATPase [Pelosinus sp. IPA-1]|uniref:ATP-dependent DNA helicase n=1 Tax=Pelosinus sp. IPA-1 TaxID=3029569 RepID=UPI002436273D|nr:AAA family ATPase [Pelosinus sp. IPA-1]GMA99985.1 ATP-dependent exodeoxyribonuclease [Pelosinus sp. IPA-1]
MSFTKISGKKESDIEQLALISFPLDRESKPRKTRMKPIKETKKEAVEEEFVPDIVSNDDILTLRSNPIAYTAQQEIALKEIDAFLLSQKESSYILAGYAGTGKTTIAENIVKYGLSLKYECIITAPTNQAVKVLKEKFGDIKVVFKTLHSILYGSPDPDTGDWVPSVTFKSYHLILVDEASMISRSVYSDLINEVQSAKAKVIFFGDSFQLEPVGDDPEILHNKNFELTEVKRQGASSEILLYATCLRNLKQIIVPNESRGAVRILGKQATARAFLQSVVQNEDSIFIIGTNKARLILNQKARQVKFGENSTDEPQNGDRILFIGNGTRFVNGDRLTLDEVTVITAKILPIRGNAEESPSTVRAYLITNNNHKILLLPAIEKSSVYHAQFLDVKEHFPVDWYDKNAISRKNELSKEVSIATYGYVITAHKSQGSQWEKVFVHQDAFRNNPRWLYTAVTRAEKELTLTSESSSYRRTWDQIT